MNRSSLRGKFIWFNISMPQFQKCSSRTQSRPSLEAARGHTDTRGHQIHTSYTELTERLASFLSSGIYNESKAWQMFCFYLKFSIYIKLELKNVWTHILYTVCIYKIRTHSLLCVCSVRVVIKYLVLWTINFLLPAQHGPQNVQLLRVPRYLVVCSKLKQIMLDGQFNNGATWIHFTFHVKWVETIQPLVPIWTKKVNNLK